MFYSKVACIIKDDRSALLWNHETAKLGEIFQMCYSFPFYYLIYLSNQRLVLFIYISKIKKKT